jgi:hypothetical protein
MGQRWDDFVANTNQALDDISALKDQLGAAAAQSKDDFNMGVGHRNENASLTFANLIDATVGDFTIALSQTIPAFKEGRNKEGGAGLLQMISALTPMMGAFGPAGGAFGGLISLALGIVSSILGAFEDQRKTLAGEIRDELRHLRAQLVHDELVAAMGDLERAYGPMQEVSNKSRTWEQMQGGWINMFEGNAAHQLNVTRSWLEKPENQSNDEWPMIFDCFWHVVDLRLLVFAVMVSKLSDGGDALKVGAMALKERGDRDRAFAKEIYPIALNRGKLWHIGNNRDVFESNYIVTDTSKDDYTKVGDVKADLVTVGPITKRAYTLEKGSGQVMTLKDRRQVIQVRGGAIDFWAMPEPSKAGPAGERLVMVAKDGNALESVLFPSSSVVMCNLQGSHMTKIRQFRSIQIGDSAYYICLGDKGKIGAAKPTDGRLPTRLQLETWIDLNDNILGISIGRDETLWNNQIVAYSESKILRRQFLPGEAFNSPKDDSSRWKPILPPPLGGMKITYLAASQNGHILICLNKKLWLFMPVSQNDTGGWNWGWKEEKKGEMQALLEEPIQGFDKYAEFWKKPST